MKKSRKSSCLQCPSGTYRIVSARIDICSNGNPVVLTLYSGSTGHIILTIPYRLLAIAPTIAESMSKNGNSLVFLPLFDQVLEIVSEGQFTVPIIREPCEREFEKINATPENPVVAE